MRNGAESIGVYTTRCAVGKNDTDMGGTQMKRQRLIIGLSGMAVTVVATICCSVYPRNTAPTQELGLHMQSMTVSSGYLDASLEPRPTFTLGATKLPSACLIALKIMILAPGFSSLLSPGA